MREVDNAMEELCSSIKNRVYTCLIPVYIFELIAFGRAGVEFSNVITPYSYTLCWSVNDYELPFQRWYHGCSNGTWVMYLKHKNIFTYVILFIIHIYTFKA